MAQFNPPKSSGGAFWMVLLSIGIFIACIAISYYGWIGPWIAHKDWVEVEVNRHDSDCRMETCYSRGGPYSCEKCTVEYEYVYDGTTYRLEQHYEMASPGKSIIAKIDPKNPQIHGKPYQSPSIVLFIIEVIVCLFALAFVMMFLSLFRSYHYLERLGRKDVIERLAAGESGAQIVAEENMAQEIMKRKLKDIQTVNELLKQKASQNQKEG